MVALPAALALVLAVPVERATIPFGQGWRWHLGDAPDGPGFGSGALAGFVPRASCTNMRPHHEWSPQGDKSAGYPAGITSCAVACSYNEACMAYDDRDACRLGFRDAVCTGTGPAPPPPAPAGACEPLKLLKHTRSSPCIKVTTFGCVAGLEEMWVDKGCGGVFECNGHNVTCLSEQYARTTCSCAAPSEPPSIRLSSTGLKQRGPTATFQHNFSFAQRDHNDAGWPAVALPHDPLINQTFDPAAGEGSAFIPRKVVWYRKHFRLPDEFRGQHIFLYFEGAFQFAEVYLNGAHVQDHSVGYTTFTVRLDNATSPLAFGTGDTNVLAVRVDPSFGSGHWYEGGGINRPLWLVVTPLLHFVQGGVFPNPNSDGASLRVSVEVEDLSAATMLRSGGSSLISETTVEHAVHLSLWDDSTGTIVAVASAGVVRNGSAVLMPREPLKTWSPQTPATYTLTATVGQDEVNVTTGVRVLDWHHAGHKATLNDKEIELQGFSHHPSFAGMGAMTNSRLALFLVQTTKALGVNFWRNSHNPYEDSLYEMLNTLGIMCWDENRQFGTIHAPEYHDMIKAHRSHPAVMVYGLCNEGQCGVENGSAAEKFMEVKNSLDPERPQNGNFVNGQEYNFPHSDWITQSGNAHLNAWHQEFPKMPISTGEHGFGNNHLLYSRGEIDRQLERLGPNASDIFSGELVGPADAGWSNLKPKQTVPFLLSSHGLGMWAMMDYYGEAWMGWPTVIKSRGHLDVAGFPRSTAWWYRTNFLANTLPSVSNYTRPLVGGQWWLQVRALTPCQFFASTPAVEVYADDVSQGRKLVNEYGMVDLRNGSSAWPPAAGPKVCNVSLVTQESTQTCSLAMGSYGCYDGIEGMWVAKGCRGKFLCNGRPTSCACIGSQGWCSNQHNCSCNQQVCHIAAKNVTVVALDSAGTPVGSHSLIAADQAGATAMELVVDVPSKSTGTGEALYLDGQDVAFVRVQLVDVVGVVARHSDDNVTWRVVSGPIRIIGVGSGKIDNHQPSQGHTYETWQGLGRVVVQATVDCTGTHRALAKQIDVGVEETVYPTSCPTEDAVLEASSSRFHATVRIPVSGDRRDSPLEVAKATKSLDTYTYFEEVQP